jgi:hypothetical protein
MIELVVLLAFVLPLCVWQLYDVSKAQKESARKREELAKQQAEPDQTQGQAARPPKDAS